jgi:tRNA dimethylallyltransferase
MQTQFDSPKIEATVLCIRWEREIIRKRIESRVDQMLRSGQVEEVKHLLTLPWGKEGRQAVGYREVVSHLQGEIDLQEARRQMIRNTAELARRQVQWFRSFSELSWVEGPDVDRMEELVREGTSA